MNTDDSFTHGDRKALQLRLKEIEKEKNMVREATERHTCIITMDALSLPAYIGEDTDRTRCSLVNFPDIFKWVNENGRNPLTNESCSTTDIHLLDSSVVNQLERERAEHQYKIEKLTSSFNSLQSTIASQKNKNDTLVQFVQSNPPQYECKMCDKSFKKDDYEDENTYQRAFRQHLKDKHPEDIVVYEGAHNHPI